MQKWILIIMLFQADLTPIAVDSVRFENERACILAKGVIDITAHRMGNELTAFCTPAAEK